MRSLYLSASLALLLPLAAHAGTIVTLSADGITLDTTLGAAPSYTNTTPGYDYAAYYVTFSNGDAGDLLFYAADEHSTYHGTYDLEAFDFTLGISATLDGPILFNGPVASPEFLPGSYMLTAETYGVPVDLTIGVTPEPSSLVLLGTGILTAAGAARRRFRKA